MTAFEDIVIDRATDFRVASAAYGGTTFDEEMDRIFRHSWVYLGHESEVAEPGMWKATWLGREPVILTRDRDGAIGAFRNFCTHRGSIRCREEYGQDTTRVCPDLSLLRH